MSADDPIELSASTYGGVALEEALDAFVAAGADGVELAIGPRWSPATRAALLARARDGLRFAGHHAFVGDPPRRPFDLGEPLNPSDLDAGLDLLAALGARRYSVHAGSYPIGARASALARFVDQTRAVQALARARGITLGVETMYPLRGGARRYLADGLGAVRELHAALPDVPWVVDLAHVGLWGDGARVEAMTALRELPLLELHASDNDGRSDTHARIQPDTWWVAHVAGWPTTTPWVLESRMSRQGVAAVREEMEKVRALRDPSTRASPHVGRHPGR